MTEALRKAQRDADRLPGGQDYLRFTLLNDAVTAFLASQPPCPECGDRGGILVKGKCTICGWDRKNALVGQPALDVVSVLSKLEIRTSVFIPPGMLWVHPETLGGTIEPGLTLSPTMRASILRGIEQVITLRESPAVASDQLTDQLLKRLLSVLS